MRVTTLLFLLACAGCSTDPPCAILSGRTGRIATEADVQARLADGGRIFSGSVECEFGWCMRDGTVAPGPQTEAALGYCTRPCASDGGCPDAMHCDTVVVVTGEVVPICVR